MDNENGSVNTPVEDPAVEAQPDPRGEEIRQLTEERDRLAGQKAELEEMLLRRQADYDNFRKRSERERLDSFEYAAMDAVKALLPIIDDFERAVKAAPEGDGPFQEYKKGVDLIYQRTLSTLTTLGLEPIEAAGKPFDPNLHFAVQKEERDDVDADTVVDEFQKGYHFKGRLLRAAMVKVAVKA